MIGDTMIDIKYVTYVFSVHGRNVLTHSFDIKHDHMSCCLMTCEQNCHVRLSGIP